MATIRWTPIAEFDLEEIAYFIWRVGRSSEAAQRIVSEIQSRVEQQAAGGSIGHVHPDAPQGWLYFRHKRWLVFYLSLSDGFYAMRVMDGSRDMPRHLPRH